MSLVHYHAINAFSVFPNSTKKKKKQPCYSLRKKNTFIKSHINNFFFVNRFRNISKSLLCGNPVILWKTKKNVFRTRALRKFSWLWLSLTLSLCLCLWLPCLSHLGCCLLACKLNSHCFWICLLPKSLTHGSFSAWCAWCP